MDAEYSFNTSHIADSNATDYRDFAETSPFRLPHIGILFGIFYGVVFLGCILGNALVVFVILKHRRMRNNTNFFLANLALSDFCVGVFCVIPNLVQRFTPYWYAGKVMCKLYFFIQCVSYTSSIIILTVISMERFCAIVYPMISRRFRRMSLMRGVIIVVWIVASAYGVPSLFAYDTLDMVENGSSVAFCMNISRDEIRIMVLINFILWYCIPLVLMIAMYTKISVVLWRSSFSMEANQRKAIASATGQLALASVSAPSSFTASTYNSTSTAQITNMKKSHAVPSVCQDEMSLEMSQDFVRKAPTKRHHRKYVSPATSRRKVIRLLVSIVASFTLCMLPHHIRVLYEMFAPITYHPTFAQFLVPPITSGLFYLNSALNPLLYAFLSGNFRTSFRDIFRPTRSAIIKELNSCSPKPSKNRRLQVEIRYSNGTLN